MIYTNLKKFRLVYFLIPLLIFTTTFFSINPISFSAHNKKLKIPTVWTKADGVTPGYDNISKNSGDSINPQIVLDSSSRPNIVWHDTTLRNCEIFFSKWNGKTWTKADGVTPGYDNVSNNNGDSWSPQIVLDSSQSPNIVWVDHTTERSDIFFSKWNGRNWTKADGITLGYDNISNNSYYSESPKIVIDSTSKPSIVWSGEIPEKKYDILFSKWNGSHWAKADGVSPGYDDVSNTSKNSTDPKIVLDSSQKISIIWRESISAINTDIFFSKWNGSAWVKADGVTTGYDNVSSNSGGSTGQEIVLDYYQRPNIIWSDVSQGSWDIFFSKWNGSTWTKADGITPGYDNISNSRGDSFDPQIVVDDFSRPNIVWYDDTLGNEDIFFSKWNGNAWTKANGKTPGYDNISSNSGDSWVPQIVLDSYQMPYIVWRDSNGILFSKWNGTTWTKADDRTPGYDILSMASRLIFMPLLVIDNNNHSHVAWVDYYLEEFDIFYTRYSQIPRLSGDSRYETAVEISSAGWDNSDYVVLARGDDFPDALAGAALAKEFDAPLLLTNCELLTGVTKDEINRLKAKEVILLGSDDALTRQIENDLEEKCNIPNTKIHRIGGVNRYETAVKIAEWIGKPPNKTCFIATGEDYPDALSASSISAIKQMPILLVKGKNGDIPQATKDALAKLDIEKTIIVGQSDVVSSSIEDWLKTNKYSPIRLGGDNRYDTWKLICDYAIKNYQITPEVVGIALGENFPDALASGPLSARFNGLVLLTREFVPSAIKDFLNTNKGKIEQYFISGGADVVSDGVAFEIRDIIEK